jgi:hypothetical protein
VNSVVAAAESNNSVVAAADFASTVIAVAVASVVEDLVVEALLHLLWHFPHCHYYKAVESLDRINFYSK